MNQGFRGVLTPSEFITLMAIESALGMDNKPKKLYIDMLSDLTGLSTRQVKRCTKALVEKEFISKKTIQKNITKRETFYALNLDRNDSENNDFEDTSVPSIQLETNINNKKRLETTVNKYNDGLPF